MGALLDLSQAAATTNAPSNPPAWAGLIVIAIAVLLWLLAPPLSGRVANVYEGTKLSKLFGNPRDYLWAGRLSAIGLLVVGTIIFINGLA